MCIFFFLWPVFASDTIITLDICHLARHTFVIRWKWQREHHISRSFDHMRGFIRAKLHPTILKIGGRGGRTGGGEKQNLIRHSAWVRCCNQRYCPTGGPGQRDEKQVCHGQVHTARSDCQLVIDETNLIALSKHSSRTLISKPIELWLIHKGAADR